MDLKNFWQGKTLKIVVGCLGAFIILLLVFQVGVFVGFSKARWSFKWGDNYHKNFGGPRNGFLRDFEGKDFVGGHGTPGTIAKIDGNNIIIKDPRGMEKIVTITDKTAIKKGMTDLKFSDLKIDDRLVIIGAPRDDGSIEAQLIRIFDPNDLSPSPKASSDQGPNPPSDKINFKNRF